MSEFKGIPILQEQRPARSGDNTPPLKVLRRSRRRQARRHGTARHLGRLRRASRGGIAQTRRGCARLGRRKRIFSVKQIVREHALEPVCEEAKCPNIGEWLERGTADHYVMGAVCTRACDFARWTLAIRGWLDADEPENVARSVELMRLKYVVLTSVNRDDLADGGSAHYAAAFAPSSGAIRHAVEALTPDFQGVMRDVTHGARFGIGCVRAERGDRQAPDSPGARPARRLRADLGVLRGAKAHRPSVLTKTSLMLAWARPGC